MAPSLTPNVSTEAMISEENALPVSANPVIVMTFSLGIRKALKPTFGVVRKLWPILIALADVAAALTILQPEAAQQVTCAAFTFASEPDRGREAAP